MPSQPIKATHPTLLTLPPLITISLTPSTLFGPPFPSFFYLWIEGMGSGLFVLMRHQRRRKKRAACHPTVSRLA
ncbi:unnamed protein product [Musa acuminata subsp. burmannicoides]